MGVSLLEEIITFSHYPTNFQTNYLKEKEKQKKKKKGKKIL